MTSFAIEKAIVPRFNKADAATSFQRSGIVNSSLCSSLLRKLIALCNFQCKFH